MLMKHARNLDEICASGFCVGCGNCQSLAGQDHVEMIMVEPDYLRPKTKQPISRNVMKTILDRLGPSYGDALNVLRDTS